jgi:hypothetical protein
MTLPIVERLQDAAMTFSGSSLRRGCVDCGLSSNLADEAADTIEELVEAMERISEHETDAPCRTAEEANSRCIGEMKRIALQTLSKIGSERP